MNDSIIIGGLAWLFKRLGGRKMTIFLATAGPIIYTVAQMAQGHVNAQMAHAITILLGVLTALGVGTAATIAHEDSQRVKASAMVEAAKADTETAKVHAAMQGGALAGSFTNPAMPG